MKKLLLGLMLLSLPAFAQQSTCIDTTMSATGRTLIAVPGGASRYVAANFTYRTTGSPTGVSISIDAGNVLVATLTPFEKIAAVTDTTSADMGKANGPFRYWYANLGTLSGGTTPTVILTSCFHTGTLISLNGPTGVITGSGTAGQPAVWDGANSIAASPAVRFADQFTGADGGAKVIAAIADLPSTGGTVNSCGLEGAQTISSTITVGGSGKPVHLIFCRNSTFTFSGTGPAFLIPESSDYSSITGLNLDMDSAAGSTYGIHVQGAWYVTLRGVSVTNWLAAQAGVKVSDDGAGSRGAYFLKMQESVIGPRTGASTSDGILLESTTSGGVTTATFVNVDAATITNGNAYNLQGGTSPAQVASINIIGGQAGLSTTGINIADGSSTNRVFGVTVNGTSIDNNSGWGITNDATVDGLFLQGVSFDSNGSGTYQTNALRIAHWGNAVQPKFYPNDANNPFLFVGPTPLRMENNGAAEFRVASTDAQAAAVGLGAEANASGFLWTIFDRLNNVRDMGKLTDESIYFNPFVSFNAGTTANQEVVTFSATPTLNAALGNSFRIVLAGNVTDCTISNPQEGQVITLIVKQSAGGSNTFACAALLGLMTISATADSRNAQSFIYDGTDTVWLATSSGVTGM